MGATPPDLGERLLTVSELAAVRLRAPGGDFLSQLGNPEPLQFVPLLEKPQALPQHFALGLVQSSFNKTDYELVEDGAKIHVHTDRIVGITRIVNY
jgi:hypothetical protein